MKLETRMVTFVEAWTPPVRPVASLAVEPYVPTGRTISFCWLAVWKVGATLVQPAGGRQDQLSVKSAQRRVSTLRRLY
jgi:hypothetical protein